MSSWFTDALKAALPAIRKNLDRALAEADRLDRALARSRGNTISPTAPIRVSAKPATQPAMPPRLREDQGVTDLNELAPWLRAEIADLRRAALAALRGYPFETPGPENSDTDHWHSHWDDLFQAPGADNYVGGRELARFPQAPYAAAFAARFDPVTALAQCDAHEALLELHGIVHRDIGWLEWDESEHAEMSAELPVCGLCVPRHSSFTRREDVPEGPCRTVRLLALAYQHRPGYLEGWRP